MSRNRPPCPKSLRTRLKKEVHSSCPICGGLPLVCAHTTKKYSEVGWNYNYLLAICGECEKKVEAGEINRQILDTKKQEFMSSFPIKNRVKPYKIKTINSTIHIGTNTITNTNIIFAYRNNKIIWFENDNGIVTINAKFYDYNGTIIGAIDKNMWVADKERFYDFTSNTKDDITAIEILGKKDDTKIKLSFSTEGIIIGESKFYIPGQAIIISPEGKLLIGGSSFDSCHFSNCGGAFNFQ